ncbi:MAG TPA: hypothetical protein VGF56_10825 [Rhizomicrobium sp.]|jgi:hypothetical protein
MNALTSFLTYLGKAWALLGRGGGSDALMLRDLFLAAASPAANKDPLQGATLYNAMAEFVDNARLQNGRFLAMKLQSKGSWDIAAQGQEIVDYYRQIAVTPAPPQNEWQARAQKKLPFEYVHVYPVNHQRGSDWRIGLNVVPGDIARSMGLVRPLLTQANAIDHVKFQTPGKANKCDTVLFFIRKDGTYDVLRGQIVAIADQLAMQPGVGAMWQEDPNKPGFGEAANPPPELTRNIGFTEYRCLVVYLAYRTCLGPRYADFLTHLAQLMPLFGLDFENPQLQGPLSARLSEDCSGYLELYRAYKNAWVPDQ